MTTTMELPPFAVAINEQTVGTGGVSAGDTPLLPPPVTIPTGLKRRVKPPLMLDRAEAYYWTAAWQDGAREAIEALVAGKFRRFDSDDPLDLARWLLDEKED